MADMKPSSRNTPNFVVIGLCVACGILGFLYWTSSKRTSVLSTDLTDSRQKFIQLQMKLLAVEKGKDDLVQKLTDKENENKASKAEVDKLKAELSPLKESLEKEKRGVADAQAKQKEKEDAEAKCRSEIAGVRKENDDNKKAVETCKSESKSEMDKERLKILDIVYDKVGLPAVKTILDNGVSSDGFSKSLNEPTKEKEKVEMKANA